LTQADICGSAERVAKITEKSAQVRRFVVDQWVDGFDGLAGVGTNRGWIHE